MIDGVLGPRTIGHGAASAATLRVDPDSGLVIAMTRNAAGRNFASYHTRLLNLIVERAEKDDMGVVRREGPKKMTWVTVHF